MTENYFDIFSHTAADNILRQRHSQDSWGEHDGDYLAFDTATFSLFELSAEEVATFCTRLNNVTGNFGKPDMFRASRNIIAWTPGDYRDAVSIKITRAITPPESQEIEAIFKEIDAKTKQTINSTSAVINKAQSFFAEFGGFHIYLNNIYESAVYTPRQNGGYFNIHTHISYSNPSQTQFAVPGIKLAEIIEKNLGRKIPKSEHGCYLHPKDLDDINKLPENKRGEIKAEFLKERNAIVTSSAAYELKGVVHIDGKNPGFAVSGLCLGNCASSRENKHDTARRWIKWLAEKFETVGAFVSGADRAVLKSATDTRSPLSANFETAKPGGLVNKIAFTVGKLVGSILPIDPAVKAKINERLDALEEKLKQENPTLCKS